MYKIGIVGGGQLGKMMILAGKYLDTCFIILDPTEHCPAHSLADGHIVADFNDEAAIKELASMVDVVTYEFEHISVKALRKLEAKGHRVYPSSETLRHIQNKYDQKLWLKEHGLPVPEFRQVKSYDALVEACDYFGYPNILKTCTGGYDGKGNAVIHDPSEIPRAYEALGSGTLPLMAERWIPFEKEVSILVCRSTNEDVAVFPVAENVHVDNILDETTVPAQISSETEQAAMALARNAVKAFNAYGMLCIELFVTKDGGLLVNELAPRPHNSGHYTIEGCVTSQYENHVRAIMGLPLGSTALLRPSAMKNLIGNRNGQTNVQGLAKAYEDGDVKVHIYGKEKVSVGRKMGHITATADTLEAALDKVRQAHSKLSF